MRRHTNDDDDDDALHDGGSVRVPMFLMDTVPARFAFDAVDHQPGYRTGERYRRAYADYCRDAGLPEADSAERVRREARADYIRRLSDAWKRPPRAAWDAAQPDLGSRPEELRRHLRTEPDDDAQARRDRAWADYCDRVSNAWRTDPRAATAIERQGERWRGGR